MLLKKKKSKIILRMIFTNTKAVMKIQAIQQALHSISPPNILL